MTAHISIVGTAGADPVLRSTPNGKSVAEFRIAVHDRRRNSDGTWSDVGVSWFGVTAWGSLGVHAAASIHRGDHVVVHGRVRVVDWEREGKSGRNVQVTADAVGHSLQFGTTSFVRGGVQHDGTDSAAEAQFASDQDVASSAAEPTDGEGWALATANEGNEPF